jgi:hypothetical protein
MHKLKIHRWALLILPILVLFNIHGGFSQNAIKDLGELLVVNGAYGELATSWVFTEVTIGVPLVTAL